MKLFKEARFILSGGFCSSEGDVHARQAIAAAKRHALPVLIGASLPQAITELRAEVNAAGIDAIVAGTVTSRDANDARAEAAVLPHAGADMLHAHVAGGFDVLLAVSKAMAATTLPFSVSVAADGGAVDDAIARLDADLDTRPWHFLLDCISPDVAQATLEATFRAAPALAHRIVGVNGDARDLTANDFATRMRAIADRFGLNVIGGGSGMDGEKFEALAAVLRA